MGNDGVIEMVTRITRVINEKLQTPPQRRLIFDQYLPPSFPTFLWFVPSAMHWSLFLSLG
jgi:hypothetical protein